MPPFKIQPSQNFQFLAPFHKLACTQLLLFVCWPFLACAFMLLTAPSVILKSKPCHQITLHYTAHCGFKLNCRKRASVTISASHFVSFLGGSILNPPKSSAWSSLEIVQFITQWVLSLHGLSFSLCSLKRADAGRPMRTQEELARPIRSLDSLNSPPIVWPSVRGPSRRERGGTLPCKTFTKRQLGFGIPPLYSFILPHGCLEYCLYISIYIYISVRGPSRRERGETLPCKTC